MLDMEIRGEAFNKAEHNRNLVQLLSGRTRGSVERKHQNISAVLIELGYPYIDGYKPFANYQKLLRDVVEERLLVATALEDRLASLVEAPPPAPSATSDILDINVPPPEPDRNKSPSVYESPSPTSFQTKRNYLELEARNSALGLAGEQLVMRFEHERLWRGGHRTLADKIAHISVSQGDRLGFDVLSYETDGRERLIEVKTTRFGALTPFFASRNEVEVSDRRNGDYQLYRVFKFSEQPKLFMLPGSLRRTCRLDPVNFTARVL